MTTNSLEERLKTHSSAFDGLLSLIPAKYYYDDATSDQWQQKKKSKKDAAKDRLAKLDPSSATSAEAHNGGGASAKDMMEHKAKNAKKVVLPGKKQAKQPEQSEPEQEQSEPEQSEQEHSEQEHSEQEDTENTKPESNDFAALSSPQLEFDDQDGGEPAKKEPQTKKKVELSPEEQKLREQRRATLKEKLASKIQLMREKRKAPGTKNGGPVKSREQMLAERKKREEHLRQEKLKRKREQVEEDNEEEQEEEEEEEEDDDNVDVLFGNIQFQDGSRMTSDLQQVRKGVDARKKKGPSNNDVKAHLQRVEAKRRKLEQLTPEERKKQEEKEQWRSVMHQAEGVKVKTDEKLLKKALKRKERQKLKSEIEWKERKQSVKDTISARQKRREANLKARKESKGKKGKNQPRLRKFTGSVQKGKGDGKKRAGFEGNAKSAKGKGRK